MSKTTTDLTVGSPSRVLTEFAIPLFASVVFQQIYNLADSLIVGQYVGEAALAAVGDSYEITLIFLAFAVGCNVGSSVVISQLFGGKRFRDLKTAVGTTFIASSVLCFLLTALGMIFCKPLLRLIHTPDSILSDASTYLEIYTAGLIFLFLYNIATGIFTALGDSKTPFYFLAGSSVANVIMDILLVQRLAVAGVAWATFICQGISCILAVSFLFHRLKSLKTEGKISFFSLPMFKKITYVAVPSILQQSFVSVGNIIIQSLINQCDVGVIAGYSAAVKFNNFAITSYSTLGNAVSNFTAQNIGAGKQDRVRQGYRSGLLLALFLILPFMLLYLLFGSHLITWFIDNPSQTAIDTGKTYLQILSPFYFAVSAKLVSDGILRGAGAMKHFMITTFSDLFLRVFLSYLLFYLMGKNSIGIWLSWPLGWVIASTISQIFYKKGVWKRAAL
jgi:putative MATE family efflux protein